MPDSPKPQVKSFSLSKTVIYSLVPLVVLLLILEVGIRLVYYQMYASYPLALEGAYEELKGRLARLASQREVKRLGDELGLDQGQGVNLFAPEGAELLAHFENLYEQSFDRLVAAVNKAGAKLLVLYIPSDFTKDSRKAQHCRSFFQRLSARHRLDFVDVTRSFAQYPVEAVSFLPQNGHLSRFGNRLVAEELSPYVRKYSHYRMPTTFKERPKIFGDLRPGENKDWLYIPSMPYRVVVNSQGLRMDYDLKFPKKKQRLLCLGDSFTFGPYLPNHDTFPGLLQQKFPDKEVINAGICGYNIADELSLFQHRAQYCEPDMVILQVLDNDLGDFYYLRRRLFARDPRAYAPSEPEMRYLTRHKSKEKAQ